MVDVWSAGVMLYVMLFCTYPFERPEDDLKDATTKYRTVGCPPTGDICICHASIVTLLEICTLEASEMVVQVLQRVIKADFSFPHNIHVSEECKDLISKILVVDPEKRLTVQQIQQHPW